MIIDNQDNKSQKSNKKKKPEKKQKLVGPSNNKIDFFRVLNCHESSDSEILSLTTLMIKNIPMKFL